MSFCRLSHNKPSSSHPCHCQSGCCAIISCCFCLMDCSWHPGKHPCVRKSPCYRAGSFSPKATLGHSPKVRLIEIHHGTRPANIVGCTDRSRTSRELGSEWLWGVLGISSRSPWFGIWYTDSQLTDRNMSNYVTIFLTETSTWICVHTYLHTHAYSSPHVLIYLHSLGWKAHHEPLSSVNQTWQWKICGNQL